MTVDADNPELPPVAETESDKPVAARRKRASKPALADNAEVASPTAAAADVPEPAAPAAPVAADVVAPVKAPRKRRVAAAVEAIAQPSEPLSAAAPPAEEASPSPSAAQQMPAAAPAAGTETGAGQSTAAAEGEPSESAEAGDAAAGGGGDEPRSGRGRRRRKPRGERNAGGGERASDGSDGAGGSAERRFDADDEDDADDDEATGAGEPRPVPADPSEVFSQVVSGEYDADADEVPEPPPPHKRVLLPEPDAPKLQKVLAQSGIGSRRDMEALIEEGEVSVNGETAHIGQRISFGDRISVRGKPIRVRIVPPPPRIIAYHKPAGEVVSHDDPQNRPTVFRRLPRLQQGKWQSVGRLDLNTEGLLLFTNSGELANQLMHPRFGVEREYAVRVLGKLDEMDKAQLLEGVNIDGQTASFRSIEDGGGEGANHWYRVVITEGRNREVRKMFDAVELTVSRLIRIRYGTVVLPRGLKRGVWVDLDKDDVRAIRQLAGGPRNEARQAQPAQGGGGRSEDRGRNKRRGEKPQNNQAKGPHNNGPRPGPRPPREDVAARPEQERNDDLDDDFDPSRIPNPLEQTFDKRFVQNPRNSASRGFGQGGGGFGPGGSSPARSAPRKPGAPREPDPLQTSVGYIGADAFHRKNKGGGGGGGGNRGGGGGGGGGFGGGRGGKRGR